MAEPGSRPPSARLRHRIPVRVRHYWKLLATCVAAMAALVLLAGNVQVTPIVTSQAAGSHDKVAFDVPGRVDLFDASIAHTLTVTYTEADYQRMFDEYMATGEKEYVRADVTVDGTLIRDVGIRLKGNSTLMGLTHEGQTASLREDRGGVRVDGPPGGAPQTRPGGGRRGGFGRVSLDSARPEELPWLMSFDEFAKGRRYQGRSEIAVRVSGMGGGGAVLNEAVSLAVLAAAGQPAQRYAYAGFQVNGRPVKARLLVEHPDENFADSLGDGVLYKALSTGRFAYQGDDPTVYADDFKQVDDKGSHDLKPVIELLRWVDGASDADFAAHLADHVDVGSFAAYVAAQNLLLNFDDMAGPGKNYYLWYDLRTARFRVVSWDHNLTFSGSAASGPHDALGMGGPGGGFGGPGGEFTPPEGTRLPEGFNPPGGGRGGLMAGNKLKERFLAADTFRDEYEAAYRDLYRVIYAQHSAEKALDRLAATLTGVAGNDAAATGSDVDSLRSLIQERAKALAEHEVIKG
ncbi:CotH kinase family protein [Catellatospora sichuanensis]|uniref:CotH kinase family protein n=1 Tax=Catellatospora sichuanensis TaxID=1969805 RepID=UPI001183832E|nr:CotH kinase family protein [Catellatospora sichuanensis]